ncbi:hypothetical protein UFOVP448_50 [uncultured Caudovirales phage]|uniref:Uncharacterized protein n=1 Tax=uncultured Caudovirales phage TaxID=2100421 RepID=A0A6J5M8A8_9CAUD|nr:hypothetical protein UFOVP448_50 [uncultured Caudovirales phage]
MLTLSARPSSPIFIYDRASNTLGYIQPQRFHNVSLNFQFPAHIEIYRIPTFPPEVRTQAESLFPQFF